MIYSLVNVAKLLTINSYSGYGFIVGVILTFLLTLCALGQLIEKRKKYRYQKLLQQGV